MRIAIMQPYFLPYVGYFQLMAAVDKFVLLDDVNFINRGWINRNRIWSNGIAEWITLPLVKASQNRLIGELEILPDDGWKAKLLRKAENSYPRASYAENALKLFAAIVSEAEGHLSTFLSHTLRRINNYLGVSVNMEPTSSVYPKDGLRGQDRILDICRRERADTYVNLPGGQKLYSRESFKAAGIELAFLDPNLQSLSLRFSGYEGPVLSILDLLMLNPVADVKKAVHTCRLTA